MVGALVVSEGQVVGRGYHKRAGLSHAEVVALDEAGQRARGADLYVTLEPCCHHARTPPCTDRILQAGIRRVVCSHVDPDPRVSGRGIAILRDAGVEVEVGLGEHEARRLNEQYLHHTVTGRPWVTLKWAQTLDGQVATRTGDSKWITGEEARTHAHRLRSWHDAVLVGIGTVLADDPHLDVRLVEGRQPWHVVLDPHLGLPVEANLLRTGQTLLVCRDDVKDERVRLWQQRGVEVRGVPGHGEMLDLAAVLEVLGRQPFQSVLVEGGPTVLTSLLREGFVNRVTVFIAPTILGTGRGAVGNLDVLLLDQAIRLREVEMTSFGEDWCVSGLYGELA
jgi:diaminohydroxyphosphoribosylaminopyrimidine deaminase/5-amino-6-(5-phosphoribosylamino)uracil reductase